MTLRISAVVLDARDMKRAIAFWTAALGYAVSDASDSWASLEDRAGRGLALSLQPNRDPKADVNRVHLDLEAADVQNEVARLEALGAARVREWPYPPGASYVVMQDPEGNEFCVVRA